MILNKLKFLIDEEIKRAKQYGDNYNSTHEFYGVILEEIEEVEQEIRNILALKVDLWFYIRTNNDKKIAEVSDELVKKSADCIHELLQVVAVIDKFQKSKNYKLIDVKKEY